MKGVNYREPRGMPYVRREYIKGKPQIKIARFSSGQFKDNYYDYKVELTCNRKDPNKTQCPRVSEISR